MSIAEKNSSGLKIPFGRRDGYLIGPSDVSEAGLACQCFCPGCGAKLMTRQGSKRRHFAHYNAPGSILCVQQSIHAAAIQVLLTAKRLTVPSMVVYAEKYSKSGSKVILSRQLGAEGTVRFDSCLEEVTFSRPECGTIRADVVGYYGDKQLLIEICFTHAVDEEKLAKVERYGHPMIEIDVANQNFDGGITALEQHVLEELHNKEWLFYPSTAEAMSSLAVQVDIEIKLRDEEYERDQARWRQIAAQRLAQAERARLHEEQAQVQERAALQARIDAYRKKPMQDKEDAIRRRLSIEDPWPHYLRRTHPDNGAIDAPFRLWQAAAFHQFVFNKPLRTTFDTFQVERWVSDWFGLVPSRGLVPRKAVVAFLNYLKGCSFLAYSGSTNGRISFSVIHNKLVPSAPVKHKTEQAQGSTAQPKSPFTPVAAIVPTQWHSAIIWNDSWPDYAKVRTAIIRRANASMSEELTLIHVLYQCRRDLPTPDEFALIVQEDLKQVSVGHFLAIHGFTKTVRVEHTLNPFISTDE
jgi:hypothetical protein